MFPRYPAAQRWGHSVVQSSPPAHLSPDHRRLAQPLPLPLAGQTSETPGNGFGPLWPFFEMHRTNGELASLRMLNDALLSVIHGHGQQPSTGCGCHSPGPCQCHQDQHHHHNDQAG